MKSTSRRTFTARTSRRAAAWRHAAWRADMPLPRSLSVGARQKFGASGASSNSRPPAFHDSTAPEALPMRTAKSVPLTVTAASSSLSWISLRPATPAMDADCGSAGTTTWSRATTWPLSAQTLLRVVAKVKFHVLTRAA